MLETKVEGIGQAHGKVILGGEHSVVHGMPAIVLPVPLKVVAKTSRLYNEDIQEGSLSIVIHSKVFEGNQVHHPKELDGYFKMVESIQNVLNIDANQRQIRIDIDSEVPIGAGFGSSAAVANAIASSVYDYYGESDKIEDIYKAVHIAEIYAHGNPSGLDMYGTSMDHPIRFAKGKSVVPIGMEESLTFVIGLTGIQVETKVAVGKVSAFFEKFPSKKKRILEEFSNVVNMMAMHMNNKGKEHLGALMTQNHTLLSCLGVSSEVLDDLVETSIKSGALGCKLSGKGIGGSVIALARDYEDGWRIGESMLEHGAVKSYVLNLDVLSTIEEI